MDKLITDHKFSPRNEWFSLCIVCRLSQAAHAESEIRYYGDDVVEDDETEEVIEEV